MSVVKLMSTMCVIFILIVVGYWLRRRNKIDDAFVTGIAMIVANICNPAITIDAAIQSGRQLSIAEFMNAFLWCVFLYAILIVASYIIPAALRIPRDLRYEYKMLMVYGNTGYIGLPVCKALFGNDSLVCVTLYNVVFALLIYTYGILIFKKAKAQQDLAKGIAAAQTDNGGIMSSLLLMFNTGTLSGIIAIMIYLVNPTIPTILSDAIGYMGDATVFLSMLVLGNSIATAPLKEYVKGSGRIIVFLVARMLVLPIALVLIMRQFITDPVTLGTLTIMLALPGANLPLIMCKERGLHDADLSKGIILSTVSCLVTIPIVCMFL